MFDFDIFHFTDYSKTTGFCTDIFETFTNFKEALSYCTEQEECNAVGIKFNSNSGALDEAAPCKSFNAQWTPDYEYLIMKRN